MPGHMQSMRVCTYIFAIHASSLASLLNAQALRNHAFTSLNVAYYCYHYHQCYCHSCHCYHQLRMGHNTWYLVTCHELSHYYYQYYCSKGHFETAAYTGKRSAEERTCPCEFMPSATTLPLLCSATTCCQPTAMSITQGTACTAPRDCL
jgi:hypothetical protein